MRRDPNRKRARTETLKSRKEKRALLRACGIANPLTVFEAKKALKFKKRDEDLVGAENVPLAVVACEKFVPNCLEIILSANLQGAGNGN